jgi:hypothetical protein
MTRVNTEYCCMIVGAPDFSSAARVTSGRCFISLPGVFTEEHFKQGLPRGLGSGRCCGLLAAQADAADP